MLSYVHVTNIYNTFSWLSIRKFVRHAVEVCPNTLPSWICLLFVFLNVQKRTTLNYNLDCSVVAVGLFACRHVFLAIN